MKFLVVSCFLFLIIAIAHVQTEEWLFDYWTEACESENILDLIKAGFMMECVKNLTIDQDEGMAAAHAKCLPDDDQIVEGNITVWEMWCEANALEDQEEKMKMQDEIKSVVTNYYECMQDERAVPNFEEMTKEEKQAFTDTINPIIQACKAGWDEIEEALEEALRSTK